MRSGSFVAAPLLAAALGFLSAAPASADIVVNIDKATQQMTVSVDGAERYEWPVSTGRSGYDTPNGSFKINRMDADHLSQEWDNAPMPHSMFFDMHGHAIHGFFDVKHLGMPVSHGCVRISPAHAATLFALVKAEGMQATKVTVSGHIPARGGEYMAQRRGPMDIAPGYAQQSQQSPYGAQPYPQQAYGQPQPRYYGQAPQSYYGQPNGQPQPSYAQQQPARGYYDQQQPYYGQQQQPYYQSQSYYGRPGYGVPPGYPPPPQ